MSKQEIVRPSTMDDVMHLAPRLREADLQEIEAASGRDPVVVLTEGLLLSRPCLTGLTPDGEPAIMFGAVPLQKDVGMVWLLGTDAVDEHAKLFLRQSRPWTAVLNATYPTLTNFVDVRNTLHVTWLKWCGFRFTKSVEWRGNTFLHFERTTDV